MRMFVCNIYLITLIYAWSPLHFTWAVFMYGPMMLVHTAILRQLNEILFYHCNWFLGFPWKLPTSMPTNSNRFPCEATIRKVTVNIQTTNTVQPMPNQHILYKFQTQEIHPTKLSQAASYRHFKHGKRPASWSQRRIKHAVFIESLACFLHSNSSDTLKRQLVSFTTAIFSWDLFSWFHYVKWSSNAFPLVYVEYVHIEYRRHRDITMISHCMMQRRNTESISPSSIVTSTSGAWELPQLPWCRHPWIQLKVGNTFCGGISPKVQLFIVFQFWVVECQWRSLEWNPSLFDWFKLVSTFIGTSIVLECHTTCMEHWSVHLQTALLTLSRWKGISIAEGSNDTIVLAGKYILQG